MLRLDDHLVEPGRNHVDELERVDDRVMLPASYLTGDENHQVADLFVQHVDDGLAVADDVVHATVDIGDPVERLWRRGDIVAVRGEHHDRRLDLLQVEERAVGQWNLALVQAVADEQVLDDELHLLGAVLEEAIPPALELQIPPRLGVDLRVQVVLLAPERVGRVEAFEVGGQVSAIDNAVTQIAQQRGNPTAAKRPAGVAHRTELVVTRPVGQRRAAEHHRSFELRGRRCQHRQRPARLAVGDREWLGRLRMAPLDFFQELGLGTQDLPDGLAGLRIGAKRDKIDWMTSPQGHSDLGLLMHAADAGAVAGARVDDHDRAFLRVRLVLWLGNYAQQHVIHRGLQIAAVDHDLVAESQQWGLSGSLELEIVVAPLPEHVEEHQGTLDRVDPVV